MAGKVMFSDKVRQAADDMERMAEASSKVSASGGGNITYIIQSGGKSGNSGSGGGGHRLIGPGESNQSPTGRSSINQGSGGGGHRLIGPGESNQSPTGRSSINQGSGGGGHRLIGNSRVASDEPTIEQFRREMERLLSQWSVVGLDIRKGGLS